MANSYNQSLFEKEWIEKSQDIKNRDKFKCTNCGNENNLHVHHLYYVNGRLPWEYPDSALVTLCNTCHSIYHLNEDNKYFSEGDLDLLKIENYTLYMKRMAELTLQEEKEEKLKKEKESAQIKKINQENLRLKQEKKERNERIMSVLLLPIFFPFYFIISVLYTCFKVMFPIVLVFLISSYLNKNLSLNNFLSLLIGISIGILTFKLIRKYLPKFGMFDGEKE